MSKKNTRHDGRIPDQLRTISIKAGIAKNATGSALCSFGDTQVICAATVEHRVPPWMRAQNVEGGWIQRNTPCSPTLRLIAKDGMYPKGSKMAGQLRYNA